MKLEKSERICDFSQLPFRPTELGSSRNDLFSFPPPSTFKTL